jgi:predicted pyridoxine 5'-phosphate oxidase superfamily flavin-nucleotide-binding protein
VGNRYLEIAATDSVKQIQERLGSRAAYARQEGQPTIHHRLGPEERAFIETQDSFFLASVSQTGWPYVQHRGGPRGFLRVLDDQTLVFPEFAGNRQYISFGNIGTEPRVSLFLIDYPNRERLKIYGRARVAERANEPDLIDPPTMPQLKNPVERGIVITVEAFDWNCSQYITPRYTVEEINQIAEPLKQRIRELEALLSMNAPTAANSSPGTVA